MNDQHFSTLSSFFERYLNPHAYLLTDLARWWKDIRTPAGIEEAQHFKEALRKALDQPGVVTPSVYEQWTGEDMDDQTEVQDRLQGIWDACFS